MIILTVMRLKHMRRVHPDQLLAKCARCRKVVAIYPSGQKVLNTYPGQVEVVCNVCHPPGDDAMLAPGAELEPLESVRKQ